MTELKPLKRAYHRILSGANGHNMVQRVAFRDKFAADGYDVSEYTDLATAKQAMVTPDPIPENAKGKPGSVLRSRLRFLGSCGSCSQLAKQLDLNGCDWCRENVDHIAGRLAANATRFLPFTDVVAGSPGMVEKLEAAGRKMVLWAVGVAESDSGENSVER